MSSLDKLGANDFLSGPAQKSSVGTVQSDFSKQLIWDSEDESLQSGVTCSSSQIPPLTLQCSTEYNSWKAELSSSCTHIFIHLEEDVSVKEEYLKRCTLQTAKIHCRVILQGKFQVL